MSEFYKFIKTYKSTDTKLQTHTSYLRVINDKSVGGAYKIPDSCYNEFYKKYYEALKKGEDLYLNEKVNNNVNFSYFLDIEVPKKDRSFRTIDNEDIKLIIENCSVCIDDLFEDAQKEYVVTKRNKNYHVNFSKLIVNSQISQILTKKLIESFGDNHIKHYIDVSVHRTGLRMYGSKKDIVSTKKDKEIHDDPDNDYSEVYEMYDLDTEEYREPKNFTEFMKMIIRKPSNVKMTKTKDEIDAMQLETETKTKTKKQSKIIVKTVDDNQISKDIQSLLLNLKETNNDGLLDNLDLKIRSLQSHKNKNGIFTYYISIEDKHCPFKNREHKRTSSPIYIDLSISGIFIKCHDEDCLGRKFPDEGFPLPDDMSINYPQLFLSMNTKYWKTEIVLTQHIKKLLEDSLSGTHYLIAKTIFNIYKDRFRIDDLRNPEWYEFDGQKWGKSYVMNVLISEEIKHYYKAIKISDESISQDTDLKEFIENKDQLETNLRNSLVDNVISKLENVTFKKNITSELYSLFKLHDPNFIENLDANPYLLGFKNGVYDLDKAVFRNGVLDDYITLSTRYEFIEYDPECEEVKEIYNFLSEIIPDKDVLEYLLKILGRSLLGINDEKFYIFTGLLGANGKSTLINFLEYCLGDYMTSADIALLTNKKALSSAASPDVIRLMGRRYINYAEPEPDDVLKTGIIKTFSGGDTIVARPLYKPPVAFKLQASSFLCCNDLPTLSSVDGGTIRRIRVINFTSRFCDNPQKPNEFKINPKIKSKIKEWKPYMMSILLHYSEVYNKEIETSGSIYEPEKVKISTNKYAIDNDKFNEYVVECVRESDKFMTLKDIYSHFIKWWSDNYPNTKTPVRKELRKSLIIKYGDEICKNNKEGFNVNIQDVIQINDDFEDY